MPTYEYLCAKCGEQFDVFQSIADRPLTVCPKEKCARKPWGKGNVKKLISAGAGLLFKGSGFYITDYRSEGYKQAAKKEAPSSASPSSESKSAGGASKSAGTGSKPAAGSTASPAGQTAKPAKSD